jgi:hypothetical protein
MQLTFQNNGEQTENGYCMAYNYPSGIRGVENTFDTASDSSFSLLTPVFKNELPPRLVKELTTKMSVMHDKQYYLR